MGRLLVLAVLFIASTAFANEEPAPIESSTNSEAHDLAPAHRYDGHVPIDLSHGRIGNNGTIGKPNPEWESLRDADLAAPGLLAAPYPYSRKDWFVNAIKDRLRFFEEAVENLEDKSNIAKKPEVDQFAEKVLPEIKSRLGQARSALKTASGAGERDWRSAEDNARAAFLNLKATYESFMKTHAD